MEHVAKLLTEKGIYFKYSGNDLLIKCLNPEHPDNNPSCRVDKVTGATHCFACGFKTNIFKYFGVFGAHLNIRTAKLKDKLKDLRIMKSGLEFPEGMVPFTHPFRGVSALTLKRFEAFYVNSPKKGEEKLEDRIIFPIRDISGNIAVFVGRHMLSNGNPRYYNFPNGIPIPLYPNRLEGSNTSIVLVEGIFDMLNVTDKGLTNAVCTFGTDTLRKETKTKLLPFKAQGISKIYIMFDGDEAGRKAAKDIKPLIEECDFEVEIINLEDDQDPGELSQEYVTSIKEYVNAR